MAMKAEDLLREGISLPDGERAGLAADLLASLDGSGHDDPEAVEVEWVEEVDRRVALQLPVRGVASLGKACASASLTISPGEPPGSPLGRGERRASRRSPLVRRA